MKKETPTTALHLAFASARDEKQQERDTVLKRCAVSLAECCAHFDAQYWAYPGDDATNNGNFDNPEIIIELFDRLKDDVQGAYKIRELLSLMSTDDAERITYGVEMACAVGLAAIDLESDGMDITKATGTVTHSSENCADCERVLSLLILSHIVDPITMPVSTLSHICHTEDETVWREYRDILLYGLDSIWEKFTAEQGVNQ